MLDKLKGLIATVAPTIATALGGPLAGVAVGALSEAVLGKPGGTQDEIAAALKTASPETLLKMKEADQAFALEMQRLNVEVDKLEAGDRADARARYVATRDWTTPAIASVVVLAWTAMNFLLVLYGSNTGLPDAVLGRILGMLDASCLMVLTFYFGTSNGARRTSDAINASLRK